MHAIVSLLDPSSTKRVQNLWRKLAKECGLDDNKITPFPHISWHVAEEYPDLKVRHRLYRIAFAADPIHISSAGLGLFTGKVPVLFISIVKDEALIRFQRRLWKLVEDLSVQPNPYYQPDEWMPHITLAHRGLTADNLSCAINDLAFQTFDWDIYLDNLALVCQEGDEVGELKERWDFPSRSAV